VDTSRPLTRASCTGAHDLGAWLHGSPATFPHLQFEVALQVVANVDIATVNVWGRPKHLIIHMVERGPLSRKVPPSIGPSFWALIGLAVGIAFATWVVFKHLHGREVASLKEQSSAQEQRRLLAEEKAHVAAQRTNEAQAQVATLSAAVKRAQEDASNVREECQSDLSSISKSSESSGSSSRHCNRTWPA